jgi:hypothetical protein
VYISAFGIGLWELKHPIMQKLSHARLAPKQHLPVSPSQPPNFCTPNRQNCDAKAICQPPLAFERKMSREKPIANIWASGWFLAIAALAGVIEA